MAKTITQLPDATVVNGSDELIIQQAGVTKRATRSELMSEAISSAKFVPTGTSATGNGMYLPGANTVAFSTGGAERLRINSAGGVGIGTTSALAGSFLNVIVGIAARVDTAGQVPYFQWYNSNGGADLKTWRVGGRSDGRLSVETVNDAYSIGNERVSISANGLVGIGTLSPSYLLDVDGTVNTSDAYRVDGVKVVGNRTTGWAAPTGTATRTTFATSTVTTAQLAERVKALIDDLTAHGLIGT